jgi:Mg-chelatase subunit ChlD
MSVVTARAFPLKNYENNVCLQIKTAQNEKRMPVHFCLLLDNSGSMDMEDKINNVKTSLHFLLDFLTEDDRISLVTFSDTAVTVCKFIKVTATEKTSLRTRFSLIEPLQSTNMSAGIIECFNCLESASAPQGVTAYKQSVILLTDGQANMGVTDSPGIINIARNMTEKFPGTSISCIGYGTDHNSELLKDIASECGGSYSVVENMEDVANVFGDILGGLMSCVAQQVKVHFPKGVVLNTHYAIHSDDNGTSVTIGDISAGMEATMIVKYIDERNIVVEGYDLGSLSMFRNVVPVINIDDPSIQVEGDAHYVRFIVIDLIEDCRHGILLGYIRPDIVRRVDECIALVTAQKEKNDYSLWELLLDELNTCKDNISKPIHNGHHASQVLSQHSAVLGLMKGIRTPARGTNAAAGAAPTPITRGFSNAVQRAISSQLQSATTTPATNAGGGGSPSFGFNEPEYNDIETPMTPIVRREDVNISGRRNMNRRPAGGSAIRSNRFQNTGIFATLSRFDTAHNHGGLDSDEEEDEEE